MKEPLWGCRNLISLSGMSNAIAYCQRVRQRSLTGAAGVGAITPAAALAGTLANVLPGILAGIAAGTATRAVLALACLLLLGGCLGASVAVPTQFPVPLLHKLPYEMGLLLDSELTSYVHEETVPEYGSWSINVGPAQEPMFTQLFIGLFDRHQQVSDASAQPASMKGVIRPSIKEVQFSIPNQTRSDYFEVWIRYEIEVFDQGQLISTLPIAAYGKANVQNYGLSSTEPALQAAAFAACRDAMAYFAVQFQREPTVRAWLDPGTGVTETAKST